MNYLKNISAQMEGLSEKLTDLVAQQLITRIKNDVPPEKIEDGELVFVFRGLPEDIVSGILRISFDHEAFIAKVVKLFPEIEEELDIESSYNYMEFVYFDELRSEVENVAIMINIPLAKELITRTIFIKV